MEKTKYKVGDCIAANSRYGTITRIIIFGEGSLEYMMANLRHAFVGLGSQTISNDYEVCYEVKWKSVKSGKFLCTERILEWEIDNMIEQQNKKDMEEKKFIKIEIPEGKELDQEAFKEGRIEWKDKALTYEDVIKKLSDDKIILPHTAGTGIFPVFSQGQLNKLIALNKLMNVAKYLNGDWKFEPLKTKGYCISMFANGKISVGYAAGRCYGDIYFKSEEDARKAISILGEEVIRQALSTDY